MKNATRFLGIIALGLIMIAADSASATEGVSPGAGDRMAQVNNACPTFSWGMDSGAVAYDLVAYLLPEDASQSAELTADTEVLFTRVAGSATSWTPSADRCFAPGGRYVWFVRAVSELAGDQVIEASEWSAGRYFTVPAAPSVDEVARALEVLQRYVAQGGDAQVLASTAAPASGGNPNAPLKGGDVGGPKSVTTASAAIRGSNPEYDVEATAWSESPTRCTAPASGQPIRRVGPTCCSTGRTTVERTPQSTSGGSTDPRQAMRPSGSAIRAEAP